MSAFEKLYELTCHRGIKLGLSNMERLDALLDFPSKKFKTVHVGGTNGKGSVSTKIAASLKGKVGLYTSPHISSFCERIRICDAMIEEWEVEELLTEIFERLENLHPTFFEITTLLAFLYFAKKGVDIAVIEVGMGGRLDATNVVTPLLSVITSIDFDHMQYLGDTLDKIAFEKGGIIKEGVPVVVGCTAHLPILKRIAEEKKAPLTVVEGEFQNYEEENQAIARCCLEQLDLPYFSEGLNKKPPCRFEVFENVILDVAHNPHGFAALFSRLKKEFHHRKIDLVLAMSSDKDVKECLKIAKSANFIYLTEAKNERAMKASELGKELLALGYTHFSVHPDVEEAFLKAKLEGDLVVVAGTFFIMEKVREFLGSGSGSELFLD